jgi:hypothetical protein
MKWHGYPGTLAEAMAMFAVADAKLRELPHTIHSRRDLSPAKIYGSLHPLRQLTRAKRKGPKPPD